MGKCGCGIKGINPKKNKELIDHYVGEHIEDAALKSQRIDELENEMFQAVFQCLPIIGEPFLCENLLHYYRVYPRFWACRWLKNMGLEDDVRFSVGALQASRGELDADGRIGNGSARGRSEAKRNPNRKKQRKNSHHPVNRRKFCNTVIPA